VRASLLDQELTLRFALPRLVDTAQRDESLREITPTMEIDQSTSIPTPKQPEKKTSQKGFLLTFFFFT
jgi:hypothetical protein